MLIIGHLKNHYKTTEKNNILAPEMTLGISKVTLDGASGNLVVRATLTVLHPTLNTPNKQIYCKTNGF